jgi:GntR family transcriptional regulator, transcriptional repressor for pyruvate dehydrogenase complex
MIRPVNSPSVKPLRAAAAAAATPAESPRFAPIRPHRTFEQICQRIRVQLAEGGLKPGDKLPPDRELAEQLGVGRNALREALRSLETAGLVERRKGAHGGAFIKQADPSRMDEVMRDLLSLGSITVAHLAEARVNVLDPVVRLACERATPTDLQALRANIERTRAASAPGRYLQRVECSREFYRLLGRATHNPVLDMLVRAVSEILMQFVYARVAAGGKPHPRLVRARIELVAAIERRDSASAARLMREHLEGVHRMLSTALGEGTFASVPPLPPDAAVAE